MLYFQNENASIPTFRATGITVYVGNKGAGDQAAMDIIKGVSPVAWQHINLFGTIEFSQTPLSIDLDALAARYDDPDYWNRALRGDLDDS